MTSRNFQSHEVTFLRRTIHRIIIAIFLLFPIIGGVIYIKGFKSKHDVSYEKFKTKKNIINYLNSIVRYDLKRNNVMHIKNKNDVKDHTIKNNTVFSKINNYQINPSILQGKRCNEVNKKEESYYNLSDLPIFQNCIIDEEVKEKILKLYKEKDYLNKNTEIGKTENHTYKCKNGFKIRMTYKMYTLVLRIEETENNVYYLKFSKSYFQDKNKNLLKELKKLDHQNIVTIDQVYFYRNIDKIIYICIKMEYLPICINYKNIRLHKLNIIKIIYDILNGLQYLHEKGLIHGDVKKDNIAGKKYENGETKYKLIDIDQIFYAKYEDRINNEIINLKSRQLSYLFGTSVYMAPEMYTNLLIHEKSDIYSLGITFFLLSIDDDDFLRKKSEHLNQKCIECESFVFDDAHKLKEKCEHMCPSYPEFDFPRQNFNCVNCFNRINQNVRCNTCKCLYNHNCHEEYKTRADFKLEKLDSKCFSEIKDEKIYEFIMLCCEEDIEKRLDSTQLLESETAKKLFLRELD